MERRLLEDAPEAAPEPAPAPVSPVEAGAAPLRRLSMRSLACESSRRRMPGSWALKMA